MYVVVQIYFGFNFFFDLDGYMQFGFNINIIIFQIFGYVNENKIFNINIKIEFGLKIFNLNV